MNNFTHLSKETQEVVFLSNEERLRYLEEPIFINYPRTKQVIDLLDRYLKTPKKPRMPNLLIIGESNIGKTTIMNKFVEMNPNYSIDDENGMHLTHKPVVLATAYTKASEKDLYIAILESFWCSFRPTDTLTKLRHQMYVLMQECHVKMLIIDEIQHFLNGTPTQQRDVMQALKNIGTKLMIPIIGVGIKEASLVLGSDAQLSSRFELVKLSVWDLDKNFRGLLQSFEKRLPLKKQSNLAGQEKATLLHQISQGNLGDLHKLLVVCARYAIEASEEEISIETIKRFKSFKPTSKLAPREIKLL